MQRSRRNFLKYLSLGTGTGLGAFSWWLSVSNQRAARIARRLIEDTRRKIAPAPAQPFPARWSDNQITLCWLGHATVLINFYGFRILTDPVLGSRVGVSLGLLGTAGIKRYVAPALDFRQLGKIDLLLLSHAHMDHLDIPTLSRFDPALPTISASATSDLLQGARRKSFTELRWGEKTLIRTPKAELEAEAFEVKHWGKRWPSEVPRGYNGYVLRREGKALIFGGDTAQTESFARLRSGRPYVAAIMPIGAYRPWIWNHCSPEQAVSMADAAGASYIIPVHHQTFRLSEEPMLEPIQRLQATLAREPERLAIREVGQTFVCPA